MNLGKYPKDDPRFALIQNRYVLIALVLFVVVCVVLKVIGIIE